jgi:cyclophilin family peptidyl-prolyl cis-trans isomerase
MATRSNNWPQNGVSNLFRPKKVPDTIGAIDTIWAIAFWAIVLCLGTILAGCNRGEPSRDDKEAAKTPENTAITPVKIVLDPRLKQSFEEATLQEPPDDESRPPDQTVAGKSIGRMYEEIAGRGGWWDKIAFNTPEGKRIQYAAVVKTDQGNITIELLADAAPNHVRSFIALAKAGYYNGLFFDRAVRQKIDGASGRELQYLEAGCPLGTGEPHSGSIGYWLKPEFSDKLTHVEGTVGACHGEELESAAAKFYITVSKAPEMDGQWTIFGRVTRGLDVARTIFQRPVQEDDPSRPKEPAVIREVTILSRIE